MLLSISLHTHPVVAEDDSCTGVFHSTNRHKYAATAWHPICFLLAPVLLVTYESAAKNTCRGSDQ